MGKRADVVVVSGEIIFFIEFKVGSEGFERRAIEQVEDYVLDLKNSHAGSHHLAIVPILVATRAKTSSIQQPDLTLSQVSKPLRSNIIDLGGILRRAAA